LKAVRIHEFGSNAVPTPDPGPDELLIKIEAASLNTADQETIALLPTSCRSSPAESLWDLSPSFVPEFGTSRLAREWWRALAVRRPEIRANIEQKSEKGVFRRGHQKAGTAGFTPHTMIDAARLAVDEIAGI